MWHIAGLPIVERNYALVVNTLLWTTVALVFIGMRLFTRAYIVKKVGMDDYLMIVAMVGTFSYATRTAQVRRKIQPHRSQ
jgi:hypothetical protein